jgi:hypothetical protein
LGGSARSYQGILESTQFGKLIATERGPLHRTIALIVFDQAAKQMTLD